MNNYFKFNILIIILFLIIKLGYAQNRTLYNMQQIQQSTLLNPAIAHDCKVFIGLPAISSIGFNVNHTAFNYSDVFKPAGDNYILNTAQIEKRLHNWNYIKAEIWTSILGVGIKFNDMYFSFDIQNKTDLKLGYKNDVINLLHGNYEYIGENNPLKLSPWAYGINYFEYAIGISKQIDNKLRVGGKIKYLKGTVMAQIKKPTFKLYTEEEMFDLTYEADATANISFPLEIEYDEKGIPQSGAVGDFNIVKDFIINNNRGFAIDVGFNYQYNDQIEIHGSILDLGFIRWKNEINNLTANGTFTFEGFDLFEVLEDDDQTYIDRLVDTIQNSYQLLNNQAPFGSYLHPKIYLGATYKVLPFLKLSALSRTDIYNKRPYASFSLSATLEPTNWFSLSVSQTTMNYSLRNIGIGFATKSGPVQFYLVTDNILFAINPKKAKHISLHTGINLYFGCKNRNKNKSKIRKSGSNDICPAYQK